MDRGNRFPATAGMLQRSRYPSSPRISPSLTPSVRLAAPVCSYPQLLPSTVQLGDARRRARPLQIDDAQIASAEPVASATAHTESVHVLGHPGRAL